MCTCIAEIKASYTQVRKQAEYAVEKSYDIDDFLDAVNVVKKQVALVTGSWHDWPACEHDPASVLPLLPRMLKLYAPEAHAFG